MFRPAVTLGVVLSLHRFPEGVPMLAPALVPQAPGVIGRKVAVTALLLCTLAIEHVAPVQSPLKALKT